MSEETPIGLKFLEKVIGIVLIILGAIITYYSTMPPEGDVSYLSGLFTAAGLIVAGAGILFRRPVTGRATVRRPAVGGGSIRQAEVGRTGILLRRPGVRRSGVRLG